MVHGVSSANIWQFQVLFVFYHCAPFLQFLNCNSQIDMFLLQVCQYLKLKTCLWSCKKEWFNLELEPKIIFQRQSGMSYIFRNSTVMARSPFQYKTELNCLQESKAIIKKKFIRNKHYLLLLPVDQEKKEKKLLYKEPHVHQISWTASQRCSVNVNHCRVWGSFPLKKKKKDKTQKPFPFVSVTGH